MDFDAYLDRELAALGRFVGVLVGNPHDAHDILADAMIVVAARWERIADMDHPTAYVRRVIVSTFLSERRTSARRRTSPVGDNVILDRPVDDPSETVLIRAETDRLLTGLPPRQRAAVVLRYYLDLDDAAIAATLGLSQGAVHSSISRALATLRVAPDSFPVEPS